MRERDEDDSPIHATGPFQPGDETEMVRQVQGFVSPPILQEIESEIFQTAPFLNEPGMKEHWQDWLYHLNHQLLADEAPTENQRWLAIQCALAMPGRVNEAQRLRQTTSVRVRAFNPHDQLNTQVSTPEDVVTYYNWYKRGESDDFSLQHVFVASKRVLLASYYVYRDEPSFSRKEQYQSHLASYNLLDLAVSLDATSPPKAPRK